MARLGTRLLAGALATVLIGCSSSTNPTPLPSGSPSLPSASQSTVPAGPPLAGRIEVTPSAVLLTGVGQTAQLTATALGQDGAAVSVTWSSSDPAQVGVDAQGNVTALTDLGSAVIYADAGDRTTPVAVLIAEPAPNAVLVADNQVVGEPHRLGAADTYPANGDRYRVTLTGVDPPAAGSILLATGSAEIAGRVLSTAVAGTNVEVEYELVPLPELFARYDFALDIPVDPRDVLGEPAASARSGADAVFASITGPAGNGGLTVADVELEKKAEFEKGPLKCTGSAAAKFKSSDFNITVTANPILQIEGRKEIENASTPEHTKVVLSGPIALDIDGGLTAEAGVDGKVECELKIAIPVGPPGLLGAVLSVTVPLGLAASADLKVKAVDVKLLLNGHLGTSVTLGFQCDSGACWAIKESTPDADNGITFKKDIKALADMRVEASVALNFVTGLGARFGTDNYSLIDAKFGPVQSLDLAFTDAQVRNTGYASAYDLKFAGEVAPGEDIKKAVDRVFGGAVSLDISAKYSPPEPLAESPKGTLAADKARVQVDKPVKLTVDLAPIDYLIFKPNVAEVRIDRWKDGALKNVTKMPMTATGQTRFDYVWTPNKDFLGMNELVAFVTTVGLPAVPLEIGPDSRAYVEVVEACVAELPTPAPPGPTAAPGSVPPVSPTAPPEDPCAADVTITFESTSFLREGHLTISGNLERYIEGVTPLRPDQPVDDFVGTGTVTGSAVDWFAMALSGKPLCDQAQIWLTANGVDVYLTATDIVEGWPGITGPALLVGAFDAQTEPPLSVLWLGGAAPRGGGSYTDVYERVAVDECGDKLTQTTTVTVAPGVAPP